MTDKNIEIMRNILGGVETGGQIYGKQRYDNYTAPYTNTNLEHTCTLGAWGFYGDEAQALVSNIRDEDPAFFNKTDTAGIGEILNKNWVNTRWNPNAAQKKVLIALISSEAGVRCQNALIDERIKKYVSRAEEYGITDVKVQMMWCEIQHLGGLNAVKRIFDRCARPYSVTNVMNSLKKDQDDASSSNQVGDKLFWSRHECCEKWINEYVKEGSESAMISNCGHDENGRYNGGAAGDQTGTEWEVRSWYNYSGGWDYMIRYPDPAVGQLIADLAREAAENDLIGYDQDERYTFWQHLKASGYRPSGITVKCEADCSSGVAAIVKAAGYLKGLAALQNVSSDCYTGNIRTALKNAGFKVYSDSKYLTSANYLLPGDLLLKEGHHICTNLTAGSSYDPESEEEWYATGTATAARDNLNIRSGPGTSYASLGQIYTGNRFETDGKTSGKWTHCKVAGIGIGWVYTAYTKADTPAPTPEPSGAADPAEEFDASIAGKYKVATALNLRRGAGTGKSIITVLPKGAYVRNYGYYTNVNGTKWFYVQYTSGGKGYVGFCSSKYLSK